MSEITTETRFIESFDLFEQHLNGDKQSFAHTHRLHAIKAFEKLGLPGRQEAWKYTNIAPLFKQEAGLNIDTKLNIAEPLTFDKLDFIKANRLVFVDGLFAPTLSEVIDAADGLVIGSLAQYIRQGHPAVEKHFNQYTRVDAESLTALNTAYTRDGAFIYVPKNVQVPHPIVVIYLSSEANGAKIAQPRNLVVVEQSGQVAMVESYQNLCKACPAVNNKVTEAVVGENASLDIYKLQVEEKNYNHVGTIQTSVGANARFSTYTVNFGGSLVRNNITVNMDGRNGEASLFGLYYLNGTDHVDNHLLINHNEPDCLSNQLYKGLLDGKSTGVFNGKVYVKKDAQKTNAFQSNKNILLSPDATINSKPELEIYADDVKCSHGATMGQMDENMLFYLRARALGEQQAKAILNQAFIGEVVDKIKIPELKAWLTDKLATQFQLEEL